MKKKSVFKRWAKEEKEILVHEQTITIRIGNKKVDLDLIHNFNFLHLDIYKASDEWGLKTKTFTAVDFCRYVMMQLYVGYHLIAFEVNLIKRGFHFCPPFDRSRKVTII
ncbi:MAG: hypothetical protein DI535_20995 [Citrobacter freundii]|nr:MAG: hypothetical protein DI535_20995 [Citrobacter freundii]